ncbi:unnamed protein product [Gordionus sp. m RMFG-2023]|uniref:uncharacterized protein LOC135925578 n=1 Tax=Gordionus sp. m RMFG-2023 TaxID=3053472 RepID=UPI0030E2E243
MHRNDYQLTLEELKEINRNFDTFDVDKKKEIKNKDLKFLLRALRFEPKTEEIKNIISKHDKNKSGYIKYDEFVKLMAKKFGENDTNSEMTNAFKLFDTQNKGSIILQDLKRIAKELCINDIDEKDLEDMITEADKNNDGKVDEEEFLKIMKKTGLY